MSQDSRNKNLLENLQRKSNPESTLVQKVGSNISSKSVLENPALTEQVNPRGRLLYGNTSGADPEYHYVPPKPKLGEVFGEYHVLEEPIQTQVGDFHNFKFETIQQSQAVGTSQELVECFHLHVHKYASEVTLLFDTSAGDSPTLDYPLECVFQDRFNSYWRVAVPVLQNVRNVKYKYKVLYQGARAPKDEQLFVRIGMCGEQNHYDIFKEHMASKKDRTFKGKLFYIAAHFQRLDLSAQGTDISQILSDIDNIGLGQNIRGKEISSDSRKSFFNWVHEELEKDLTPYSSAAICSLLGQFFREKLPSNFFKTILRNKSEIADGLLIQLSKCSRAHLPQQAMEFIEQIHLEFVKASTKIGITNLQYVQLFGHLFPSDVVIHGAAYYKDPEADKFDDIARNVIQSLVNTQDITRKYLLIKYVISKVPTVSSLWMVVRQLDENNSYEPHYEEIIIDRFPIFIRKERDITLSLWKEIPGTLRSKLAVMFLQELKQRLDKGVQPFDASFITELILDDDLQKGASNELVQFLKFLSKSSQQDHTKAQKHYFVVCSVVKDDRFLSFWEKIKEKDAPEIVQNLAASTIQLVYSFELEKENVEEYIVAIFLQLDELSKIPALEEYESVMEKCICEHLRAFSLEKIIRAYDEMQKAEQLKPAQNVQKWFITVVIKFLRIENPDVSVKSKLLNYTVALSSSKDVEMNLKRREILFLLLDKSMVPRLKLRSTPNQDEIRSVVDAVLSDRKMWEIIFEEAMLDSRLSKHHTYLDVKNVMDKLTISFIDGHISLNSIMDEDDMNRYADFLELGRCIPPGIMSESVANLRCEWIQILNELLTEKDKIKRDFIMLQRAINLAIEISDGQQLALKDVKTLSEEYNRLKRMLKNTEFADVRQENYWGPLKSILNSAEVIHELYNSIIFKNFAKNRLEERLQTNQRETTVSHCQNGDNDRHVASVEEILTGLKEGVEAFKGIIKRISQEDSKVTSKELDKLLMDIEEHDIKKEFDSLCKILRLADLSVNVLKMIKDYLRFDVMKKNIQAAIECLGAVGYDPKSDEDNFMKALHSFMNCKESGTLSSVSAYMNEPNIMKIHNQLSQDLVETLRELSRARELIEFIIETAQDKMEDLVDAVEEYSEQLIQASTVTYLIDVHRFFSALLSNKPEKPEIFLENVCRAYINITADIPSSPPTGETLARSKVNMAAKIKIVSCNVHSLRCLHMMLSNRQEVTKDIIKNAVNIGSYQVWIAVDGSVDVQLTYERDDQNKTEAKYNIDDLNDLRSRALLLVNAEKTHKNAMDGEKASLDYQKDLMLFIDQVDILTQIVRKYEVLKSSGIPAYDEYFWKNLKTIDEIRQEEARVNKEGQEWDDMIQSIRKQNFFLNYFHTKQLWLLKSFFNSYIRSAKDVSDEVLALFHYIDGRVSKDDLLSFHSKYSKPSLVEDELCVIGETLKMIFRSYNYCENLPTVECSTYNKIDEVVEPSRLYIDVLESGSIQTVHVIMALFRNTCGCLPKSSQLLFCSPSTSWDEIELLLLRTFEAHRHGFTSNLHCIANVECLSNDIQLKLVEKLEVLVGTTDAPYLLAIVCRGANQHIADHFSDYVHYYSGMPDAEMRKTLQDSCPDTFLVTGDLPGLGKSEEIHALAIEKDKDIVTFPISGPFVRGNLVKRLSELKLEHFQSIHFDVGEVDDPSALDTFLFELIATKMLSTADLIFSLVTSDIYIEVANTFQQLMKNSLPVCNCFKRIEVEWKDYSNLLASSELTSCIQVVCHYLNAHDNGSLEHEEVFLSGPKKAEPLSDDKCKELLKKYFSVPGGDLNFNILRSFLSVLANQLLKFSRNPYLKPKNLKDMALNKHQHIRNDVFDALLEVSKTFAARPINTCKKFQVEVEEACGGLQMLKGGNMTAEKMVDRVKGMTQWDEIQHLVIMLHTSGPITTIYRDLNKVPQNVKDLLESQDVFKKGLKDYSTMSQNELQERLERIADNPDLNRRKLESMKYALTPDNLLKMALIIQRIQAGIPVIIMGETGCGKTSLVRYLAQTCSVRFEVFSCHAGITEQQIIDFISSQDKEATNLQQEGKSLWVFLDEINTCDYLGTINEIVCHRSIQGRELSSNLIFVAACNPYRLRPQGCIMTAGLTGKTSFDEFSKLVYRVHPLPETMIDYVWDYGSLSQEDERAYIGRMVKGLFDDAEHTMLVDLLATSQQFIRDEDKSSFCVSLRDVQRATILMDWFYTALSNRTMYRIRTRDRPLLLQRFFITSGVISNTLKGIVLALAHCYLSRLPSSNLRQKYCSKMTEILIAHNKGEFERNAEAFEHIVRAEQEDYLSRMELPKGTAKNAALRENVFVTLVCILNRIPVFIVGKPGCSKSLSMQIIRSNLRGRDSKDPYLMTLPKLVVVSFQGSESSTSEGIKKVFEKAKKFESEDALPVVLLDEIGLAENSKFNPLKVLHHLLEKDKGEYPDVAVVGISNWALDAAKMNRAIHLSRPEPDHNDLYETGLSISGVKRIDENSKAREIECLADAYSEYQKNQTHENFHGLRDYYSVVKCFDISNRSSDANGKKIQRAMQRNFGGTTKGKGDLQSAFLKKLESSMPIGDVEEFHVTDLIKDNLNDRMARHLMLITSGDSAIGILDQILKDLNKEKIIIFGSHFEEDLSADYSHRILSRIILCMEHNCILILRDLERIYGSLYDMLNQNYVLVGGKNICRIALGAFSNPLCQVDEGFRCIVLVDENKVDYCDPPFLNRFEKQLLRFVDILNDRQRKLINDLDNWVKSISFVEANGATFDESGMFAGFHDETLQSLVLLHSQVSNRSNEEVLERCKDDLMSIAMPEAVIRIFRSELNSLNKGEAQKVYADYFNKPINDGLKTFLKHTLKAHEKKGHVSRGMNLFVMTHSGILTDVSQCIGDLFVVQTGKLSFSKSEKDLSKRIKHFFWKSKANLLVVQCRPETDARNILLMKIIIEECQKDFINSCESHGNQKHVCIVMHLRRSTQQEEEVRECWQFNFLSGWAQVMIDCLEEPTIEIKELLKCSIIDLVTNETVPFKKVAADQLHWCFTRIKYRLSKQPTLDDISSLIRAITSCKEIMDCFMTLCCRCIEHEQGDTNLNWKVDVACKGPLLINSSTFVKAIEHFIIRLMRPFLARIVYFLQKHSAFQALTSDILSRQECLKLLLNESIFNTADVPEPQEAESLVVDFSHADLQFPFSHLFCKRIDGLYDFFSMEYRQQCMKEENLDENEELRDDSINILVKKMSFKVEQVVTEIIASEILSQKIPFYVDDFLAIKTYSMSDSLNRNQRIGIMKAHYGKSLPKIAHADVIDVSSVIAQFHCNFWLEGNDIPEVFHFIKDCTSTGLFCIDDLLSEYWDLNRHVKTKGEETNPLESSDLPNEETRYVDIVKEECGDKSAEENDDPPLQPEENDEDSEFPIQETREGCSERAVSPENMADEQMCKDSKGGNFGFESKSSEYDQRDVEEEQEENTNPLFEEFLVEEVCSSFLPTQAFVHENGGVSEWKNVVNLVLSSATEYCPLLPAYYYLKFCNDFACRFDQPDSLYALGELGRKVTDGTFLGSPAMMDAVCNLLEDLRVKGRDNKQLDELLFLFYERCIQSNPDSEMNIRILNQVSFSENDHMLPLASSLLNKMLVSAQDQMAFSLETLEHLITSTKLDDFPNLMALNSILSRLQENEKELDSHINVVCCDLITRIAFKDLDVEKLSRASSSKVEMKVFHKAVDVLTEVDQNCKSNLFGFICAVSYLRAFMSALARLLSETRSTASLDPLLRALTTRLNESEPLTRKSAVSEYLLKELGQLMCLHDVQQLIQNCKHLHVLKSLGWKDTDSSDHKLRCNLFKRQTAASKLVPALSSCMECRNPKGSEKISEFLKDSFHERLQLAAIMMERFYMVRSLHELNATEKEEAHSITTILSQEAIPNHTYNNFISRISGQSSFMCKHLEISQQTRTIDVQVAVLIQHLSAILTSSVTSKRTNPVIGCLINPAELKTSYIVSSPDSETGYPLYKNCKHTIPPYIQLVSCKCGTRFAGQLSANIKCPCCNSPCQEDERDEQEEQEKPQAIQGYIKLNLKSLTCDMLHTRNLDPVPFRLLHLIMHTALLAGLSIDVVPADELSDVMKDDNPSETCYKVIQVDLDVLCRLLCSKKENIITLVHHVIEEDSVLKLLTEDSIHPLPHNEQVRSSWETDFAEKAQPVIKRFIEGHVVHDVEENDNATLAALVYERHLPKFEDITSRNQSIPRLFRVTQPNSFHKLREVYLNSPKEVKEKYQLLGLFLDYHDKLHFIGNLAALLSWSRYVEILLSRGLTRSDAQKRYINDTVLGKEGEGFQSTSGELTKQEECEEFINAWRNVVPLMNELNIQHSDEMPYISKQSPIGYCLAEKQDLGRFLCRCFVSLAEMQNDFLDKCLAIASNGKCSALHFLSKSGSVPSIPVIHVQNAKKKEIICYEWTDGFLDSSYCETEYGQGKVIQYEMEKVEKELAGYFLLGKAYLDTTSGIREFAFSKQLFHDCANILNELCESIPQDELPPSVKAELANQSMYRIQTLLEDLELVLCYLRRMEVKPNHSFVEYIDILVSSSRPFPKDLRTTLNTIQIKHVCALYEFVEDQLAVPSVECCGEEYRDKIRDETLNELRVSVQDVHRDVLKAANTVITRFAFRYLHMKPNQCKCLLEFMKDPSLWPMALRVQRDDIDFKVSEVAPKFFPEEITIGQTYEVHRFYKELNQSPSKSRHSGVRPRTAVARGRKGRKSFT